MKQEWKQTIFSPETLNAGDYIVKESKRLENKGEFISNTGYLGTMLQKVGWTQQVRREGRTGNQYILIDMSDGLITEGYFTNSDNEDHSKWIWNTFDAEKAAESKQKICDYLNNNPYGETYRYATHEEIVRVALHQAHRTR
jgi:hypothetical protein